MANHGELHQDEEGSEHASQHDAWIEATEACGQMMRDLDGALKIGPEWRMEVTKTARGVLLINDAYNANPASTEAALRALAAVPARRRVAVLGPMLELGDLSHEEHRRIAAVAASRTTGSVA